MRERRMRASPVRREPAGRRTAARARRAWPSRPERRRRPIECRRAVRSPVRSSGRGPRFRTPEGERECEEGGRIPPPGAAPQSSGVRNRAPITPADRSRTTIPTPSAELLDSPETRAVRECPCPAARVAGSRAKTIVHGPFGCRDPVGRFASFPTRFTVNDFHRTWSTAICVAPGHPASPVTATGVTTWLRRGPRETRLDACTSFGRSGEVPG